MKIPTTPQKNNLHVMYNTNQRVCPWVGCVFTWGHSVDGPLLSNDVLLQPPLQRKPPPLFCLPLSLCLLELAQYRRECSRQTRHEQLIWNFFFNVNKIINAISSIYHFILSLSFSSFGLWCLGTFLSSFHQHDYSLPICKKRFFMVPFLL